MTEFLIFGGVLAAFAITYSSLSVSVRRRTWRAKQRKKGTFKKWM